MGLTSAGGEDDIPLLNMALPQARRRRGPKSFNRDRGRNLTNLMSMKKLFFLLMVLSLLAGVWFYFQSYNESGLKSFKRSHLKVPPPQCIFNMTSTMYHSSSEDEKDEEGLPMPTKNSARVLVVPKTSFSKTFKAVTAILVANKIKYKASVAGKNLPDLIKISKGVGRYGAIYFEDYRSYLEMDYWNRDLLDKYCRLFKIGIIASVPNDASGHEKSNTLHDKTGKSAPLKLASVAGMTDVTIGTNSNLLRVTKGGLTEPNTILDSQQWTGLEVDDGKLVPLAWASKASGNSSKSIPVVLQDLGIKDGVPKVIFGSTLDHFVSKLLFLDALSWVSLKRIAIPLTRYILVDIDDIFVGKHRMLPADVDALVQSQERLSRLVPGFRYNLGFSGGYFHSGTEEENQGDDALLANKDKFWWFPHMWKHQQAHKYQNVSELKEQMEMNKQFALNHGIPVHYTYSVAPHHAGVYPVHNELYEAWKEVWGITVTSTEEYPHLRPARMRKGFIHQDIHVLPRQTCGLFTKNLFYDEYPKGPEVLEASINGGELFETIMFNPISVFMTHMPNYCYDRLAPYTFEAVVNKIKCWTNFKLMTRNPEELADIYFELNPDEKTPIWGNPCLDRRHMDIWAANKSCERLPNFLVVGPQKTGTTALYTFLKMHPSIRSNLPSPVSYEELQFFSRENYSRGIDWYLSFFPLETGVSDDEATKNELVYFEKSATYFDFDKAPIRAHSLLPEAQIIIILISPIKRAYSWYHHVRAHDDETALEHSFHEVITADEVSAPKALRQLQSRCLEPGKYAPHIEKWLNFYKSQQLILIDGEKFKVDPIPIMNDLQHTLDIQPVIDYAEKIVFDSRKGYFCEKRQKNRNKCLGVGKGRKYPPMEEKSQKYLRTYYRLYNEALLKLMTRLGYPIPPWLEEDLNGTSAPGVKADDQHDLNVV